MEYRKLRSNDEIFIETENISEVMRKKGLVFFGHLYRMQDNRFTKKIFKYLWDKKLTTSLFREVKKGFKKNYIEAEEVTEKCLGKND